METGRKALEGVRIGADVLKEAAQVVIAVREAGGWRTVRGGDSGRMYRKAVGPTEDAEDTTVRRPCLTEDPSRGLIGLDTGIYTRQGF
jgi:hypothetical protein